VWGDADRAEQAVDSEASARRSVVLLSDSVPSEAPAMRALIRRQIDDAVQREWPAMERRHADINAIPAPLADALALALGLTPQGEGQVAAQREMVASIQKALDARRQRIVVSGSRVNSVKWAGLFGLAVLMLATVAFVHIGNRTTAAVAMASSRRPWRSSS
jgi:hypothetical protein